MIFTNFFFKAWGQFIIHDILQTPNAAPNRNDSLTGRTCSCTDEPLADDYARSCYQIELKDDPTFSWECIHILRSGAKIGEQFDGLVREQAR